MAILDADGSNKEPVNQGEVNAGQLYAVPAPVTATNRLLPPCTRLRLPTMFQSGLIGRASDGFRVGYNKGSQSYIIKILAAWAAAVVVAGFPTSLLINAMALGN